jgi:phosphoribosylanthranilate isomerase
MIIKVCGITRAEDAHAAIRFGANALGFNFYPRSPRYLAPEQAARILQDLPGVVLKVGVFVNARPLEVKEIAQTAGLNVVQLHGETAESHWILAGCSTWRAFPVGPRFHAQLLEDHPADAYLLDTPSALHGGSGQTFEWDRVRGLPHRIVLAGGLDGTNVGSAIAAVRPWGVDACSRLESSPGIKDHRKMNHFIQAALHVSAGFSG